MLSATIGGDGNTATATRRGHYGNPAKVSTHQK